MKKIDIESGVRIYSNTKDDIIDVMSLIGEKVYVSSTKDFECYGIFKLAGVKFVLNKNECFIVDTLGGTQLSYKYLILAKDVKFKKEEKKLRPYKDVEELFRVNGLALGKVIRCRNKDSIREYVIVLSGYTSDNLVMIGGAYRTLSELFNCCEYYDNDTSDWKPFGVEE